MNNIAIIGGTGSLGSQLSRYYYKKGLAVSILSRDPHKQRALMEELPHARFVLGDVCDYEAVSRACEDVEAVVHTAALKHVDMGEEHVLEYVRVNVQGAVVVADVCKSQKIEKAVFISSDKAVSPINLYGKTKAVGEDVFIRNGYSVLRYGNVVDSRGSFVDFWRKMRQEGRPIQIRKPVPTRFYLRIKDAVELVDAVLNYWDNGVFVPFGLRTFDIADVAAACSIHNIEYTELLPGEKQHEVLVAKQEQGSRIVQDDLDRPELARVYKGYSGMLNHNDFCSETAPRMNEEELLEAFTQLGLLELGVGYRAFALRSAK